jgi:hypothetical protein
MTQRLPASTVIRQALTSYVLLSYLTLLYIYSALYDIAVVVNVCHSNMVLIWSSAPEPKHVNQSKLLLKIDLCSDPCQYSFGHVGHI